MGAAIDDSVMAGFHFYQLGMQYYAAGRFAAVNAMIPVAGNLLHHAFEMILKGNLVKQYSLEQIKDCGHKLRKSWGRFKARYPNENLARFDGFVDGLDEFENLRYPDDLLQNGAHITLGFTPGQTGSGFSPLPGQPYYDLSIADFDALMKQIFRLCGIDPSRFLLAPGAIESVTQFNASCIGWFPKHEDATKARMCKIDSAGL